MSRSIVERGQPLSSGIQAINLPVVLPAAGAFVDTLTVQISQNGLNEVAVWLNYLSASATGQLAIRPLFDFVYSSNVVPPNYNLGILDPAVIAAQPFGTRKVYQETLLGPIPGSGFRTQFVVRIPIPQGAVAFALSLADLGTAPGSLTGCQITLGSNGSGLPS